EDAASIQLEVLVLVADGAPIENALVGRIALVEHPIEWDRLARAGVEHPGDVIGASIRVANDAPPPRFARHAGLRTPAGVEELGPEEGGSVGGARCRERGRLGGSDNSRCGAGRNINDGDRAADEVEDVSE